MARKEHFAHRRHAASPELGRCAQTATAHGRQEGRSAISERAHSGPTSKREHAGDHLRMAFIWLHLKRTISTFISRSTTVRLSYRGSLQVIAAQQVEAISGLPRFEFAES